MSFDLQPRRNPSDNYSGTRETSRRRTDQGAAAAHTPQQADRQRPSLRQEGLRTVQNAAAAAAASAAGPGAARAAALAAGAAVAPASFQRQHTEPFLGAPPPAAAAPVIAAPATARAAIAAGRPRASWAAPVSLDLTYVPQKTVGQYRKNPGEK